MVAQSKVRTNLANAAVDGALLRAGLDIVATAASGVTNTSKGGVVRRCSLKLTAVAVAVTAALDYGSIQIADLPDGNLLYLGGIADLVATKTTISGALSTIDVGVGTAAASNATLSSTMIDIIPKIDSDAGGLVKGAATSTEAAKVFATSNTDLFLNVAVATTTDGTVTLDGTIELFYLDLGNQA